MKKKAWIAIIIMVITVIAYFSSWFEVYSNAKRFYQKAQELEAQGKIVEALEGYEEYDYEKDVYLRWAGYVHISIMFDGLLVSMKPPITKSAKKKVFELISGMTDTQLIKYLKLIMKKNHPYKLHVAAELIIRYEKAGNSPKSNYYKRLYEKMGGDPQNIEKYYFEIHGGDNREIL